MSEESFPTDNFEPESSDVSSGSRADADPRPAAELEAAPSDAASSDAASSDAASSSHRRRLGSRRTLYLSAAVLGAVIALGAFVFHGWVMSAWWHVSSGAEVSWAGSEVPLPLSWRLERQGEGSLVLASASGDFLTIHSLGGEVDPVVWAQNIEAQLGVETSLVAVAGFDAVEFSDGEATQWMVARFGDLIRLEGSDRDGALALLEKLYASAAASSDTDADTGTDTDTDSGSGSGSSPASSPSSSQPQEPVTSVAG